MEVAKKSNIIFIFFLTFGYILFHSFAVPLDLSQDFFSIFFRIMLFLFSWYIIFINFENVRRRKLTVIFAGIFWLFYLFKAFLSFDNDVYLPRIVKDEYKIYIRIICLNLVPYIAVLSINFSKEITIKLNTLIFNFLLITLGISCFYTIFISKNFEKSYGIFFNYYISVGHYGLSLLILSLYNYFLAPQKLVKPVLGILIGIFVIFSSSARSPILATFIIILALLIYVKKLKYWIALLLCTFLFIVGIYCLKQTSLSEFGFVKRIYDAIFEGNGYGRSYFLLKGWNVFKENVFFGGRIMFEDGMYPHNIFVEILMSMGITGIVLFCLYFRDFGKFKMRYIKEKIYYLPFFLFFIQYFVLALTSNSIYGNMEFWGFAAVVVSIILFCYDEEIKSNNSRGNTTGNH